MARDREIYSASDVDWEGDFHLQLRCPQYWAVCKHYQIPSSGFETGGVVRVFTCPHKISIHVTVDGRIIGWMKDLSFVSCSLEIPDNSPNCYFMISFWVCTESGALMDSECDVWSWWSCDVIQDSNCLAIWPSVLSGGHLFHLIDVGFCQKQSNVCLILLQGHIFEWLCQWAPFVSMW